MGSFKNPRSRKRGKRPENLAEGTCKKILGTLDENDEKKHVLTVFLIPVGELPPLLCARPENLIEGTCKKILGILEKNDEKKHILIDFLTPSGELPLLLCAPPTPIQWRYVYLAASIYIIVVACHLNVRTTLGGPLYTGMCSKQGYMYFPGTCI